MSFFGPSKSSLPGKNSSSGNNRNLGKDNLNFKKGPEKIGMDKVRSGMSKWQDPTRYSGSYGMGSREKGEYMRELHKRYGYDSKLSPEELNKEIKRVKGLESAARYQVRDSRTVDQFRDQLRILESIKKNSEKK